ncbi:MAG: alpha/beta hydrolase [Monoglobaceae bacterium]
MKKTTKIVLIVLAVIVAIVVVLTFVFLGALRKSLSAPVADYDTRIEIWNTVAGNSSHSKLDDMNIDYDGNLLISTMRFTDVIACEDYKDVERTIDTFTYLQAIKGGYEKETYEDQPYIIPYLVPNSKGAVIVIPGGGFAYKSMDGTTGEGKDIALELNEAGYNAFVLHYRSNPYEYPIPQLDVQRAVRYLRYHADDFGFDPDKIGMIGFSAGGNQVGTYINLIMGNDLSPDDYTPDEIDAVDDTVIAPAMIYPALTYNYNVPMLFSMFDDEAVRAESTRNELLNLMDLKQHINAAVTNQFISYGTKDGMVGMDGAIAYFDSARNSGVSVTVAVAEGKDHGYTFECYKEAYLSWLKEAFGELQ